MSSAVCRPDDHGSVDQISGLLSRLAALVDDDVPQMLRDLAHLVNIDSGTFDKDGVDTVGRWVGTFLADLGGRVDVRPDDVFGDTVVGVFDGALALGPTVVLVGHLDTVFDRGTSSERPFRIDGERGYGPGVIDMKGGLLVGLYAIRALASLFGGLGALPARCVIFVANSDEEIGSPSSSHVINEFAADADAAFVLEAARANGDIVSARKGVVDFRLTVNGRAAHAGVEFERGRNAISAAATMIEHLQRLGSSRPELTLNIGVITGGSRTNVVAERCTVDFEVRSTNSSDLEELRRRIATELPGLAPDGVSLELEVVSEIPPMEKSARTVPIAAHALRIAAQLGLQIRDVTTGGGSDANLISSLGIPTLDGLGPVGAGDHSSAEYVELASFATRTTLLAALIAEVIVDPSCRWRST